MVRRNGYSVYYYAGRRPGPATRAGRRRETLRSARRWLCCAETSLSDEDVGADDGGAGDGRRRGTGSGGYDFTELPQTMSFKLGFSTPTNYVNCVNYTQGGWRSAAKTNAHGAAGRAGLHQQSVVAQVTVHMDHPFWESFAEDTPVHWDQIATQYVGQTGIPTARIEDLQGVAFDPFTDKLGNVMPWRELRPGRPQYAAPTNGAISFSTLSVPQDPNGVCTGPTGAGFLH